NPFDGFNSHQVFSTSILGNNGGWDFKTVPGFNCPQRGPVLAAPKISNTAAVFSGMTGANMIVAIRKPSAAVYNTRLAAFISVLANFQGAWASIYLLSTRTKSKTDV